MNRFTYTTVFGIMGALAPLAVNANTDEVAKTAEQESAATELKAITIDSKAECTSWEIRCTSG